MLGGIYEDYWGWGTKTTPKLPLYAVTAKNKIYKYVMLLRHDFRSPGLLPILHKFGKGPSLFPMCQQERSQEARITIHKETSTYACVKNLF